MPALIPFVKKQDRKPFVLSGKKSYYIGYSDLREEGIGYHIDKEMNGLWFPPLRILKWITVKQDQESLTPDTVTIGYSSVVFNYDKFQLRFNLSGGSYFRAELEAETLITKPLSIILEIGILPVWFSDKSADYDIYSDENRIILDEKSYGIKAVISSSNSENLTFGRDRIIFNTSGSAKIDITVNRIENTGNYKGIKDDEFVEFESEFGKSIKEKTAVYGNRKISEAFESAVLNLKWMFLDVNELGAGIVAGFPDFPWFFGIDSYYSSRGLLISGMHNELESTLKILESNGISKDGKMPHEIVSNGRIFNSGNLVESIAYLSMVWNLYDYVGNIRILEQRKELIMKSANGFFKGGLVGTGIMEDPGAGKGIDIDTICNYIESMNAILKMKSAIDLDDIEADDIKREIRDKTSFLIDKMWMDEVQGYADRYVDGVPEFNGFWTSILPFSFGYASTPQYRKFMSESSQGTKTLMGAEGIKVDKNGNVMANGNSMVIKACLNYYDASRALTFLESNLRSIGKYSSLCFPEIINNPSGCFIQSWSAALFIENIIHDFLGIRPNGDVLNVLNRFKIPDIFEDLQVKGMKYRNRSYNFEVRFGRCNQAD